ncbi:MAG: FAD:protein FMN transferase [Candidatus Omnitrophota bacterium]
MRRAMPTNRRSFFSEGFKKLAGQAAEALDLKNPLAFLGLDRSYVRMRREAMASHFEVIFGTYEKAQARETGMYVLDEIDRFDYLLNIWRGRSELKEVNERAALEPVPVGEEIAEMVKLAKRIHRETEGAFDITTTPLSRCWGFFQRKGVIPHPEDIEAAKKRIGMDGIALDEERKTIQFTKPDIEITPASIGKGLALDHAMKIARDRGLKDVLLNGGFSSVLASGAPAWKESWQIDVRNPFDCERPIARLQLKNQGFSSSGSEEQFFLHEGKRYGHIIDPRTGWPSCKVFSVSVVAPTAALAEALSTAFCVMGVEKTLEYCENRKDKDIGAILIPMPDDKGRSEIIASNFNTDCVEVLIKSCQTKNRDIV